MLKELMEAFCNETEGCTFRKEYSGRGMCGRKCSGIVIKQGYSYLKVIMSFTKFLSENGFSYDGCELLNPAIDELGLKTIIYFPCMIEE